MVSTHAPLAGSDEYPDEVLTAARLLQPTLPLRGATLLRFSRRTPIQFQPTLPLRGATICDRRARHAYTSFNPRSPCGERLADGEGITHESVFQPTLPLRGATRWRGSGSTSWPRFNPRSPCGERHSGLAPRRRHPRFNPRSPCGERPSLVMPSPMALLFQPTLPLRGATIL